MDTIRLQTNQNRLIANLRHAFAPHAMLGELLQNARRARASHIHVTAEGNTLTVTDDGTGIANLQTLIHIAESGWDDALKARENAFGLGVLSTLYFSKRLGVHSRDHAFSAETAAIIRGDAIPTHTAPVRIGTEIRLDGVRSPQSGQSLAEWVRGQLTRLCEAFPIPVSFNGIEIARPLSDPKLPWRQTDMGRVLIFLSASPRQWSCFLQGLPIGGHNTNYTRQVVLLPDDTLAKLPDRQSLLHEAEDHVRIQAAVNTAYRDALCSARAHLPPEEFIRYYAENCLNSSNADLLNDLPYAPDCWFRDWDSNPAGFSRYWETSYSTETLVTRERIESTGVWQIETDGDPVYLAETYLEAAEAFLLEEERLDANHWLRMQVRPISSEQIKVRRGASLHHDKAPCLAEYDLELELVEALHVELDDGPGHDVPAVLDGNILYVTPGATRCTRFVSDYVYDDRYNEDREDEDARTIATFIAVGRSTSPAQVLEALLPDDIRHQSQPKLANATLSLSFDDKGRLSTIH